MAVGQQQQQHQGRPPSCPKGKTGHLGSFEEPVASSKPRPSSPAPARPTIFRHGWKPHPTSPNLLVKPGLDSRDPLAGTVATRQEDYIAKTRKRLRELQSFEFRSKEVPRDLFGPTGATNTKASAREAGNTTPGVESAPFSPANPFTGLRIPQGPHFDDTGSSPASSLAAPPEAYPSSGQNTVVTSPGQPTVVQVTNSSGTRGSIVQGLDFKIITVRRAQRGTPSACFEQNCSPGSNTSRKRPAEDSELDLTVANAAEQNQSEQEPFTTTPSVAAGVASDEGIVPQGRAAWLVNIMTSVRGAVNKASSSIAGYVYPRNYNVVERHSRDQQTGNIGTKRIKLELADDSVDEAMAVQQSRAAHSATPKHNLVWVDESTRVAHWHQVAPLVRALRSISRRIEKGLSGSRDGSPASRGDDDARSQRIYTLGAYVTIFQQTAFVLETVYSHTFLAKLKDTFKFPQSIMDYDVSPDEFLAIKAAQQFVDDFPDECSPVLVESGVTQRILRGIGADLDALANRRPMPNLVQRAGLVGKVIKFFRGRDSFGMEALDEPVSKLAVEMPGSFPDAQVKSESVDEEDNPPRDVHEHRPGTRLSYLPPVRTTDTYTFVREQLAEIAIRRRAAYQEGPASMALEDLLPRPSPISILKRDSQSPVVLKRLQKARGLKKVQFSPSAKLSTPSSAKPAGFFNKLFGSPTVIGSPLRRATENSSLNSAQTDGSPDSRSSERSGRLAGIGQETDNTSEDSDGEAAAARCQPRLVQHLNKSLKGLEAKGFFVKDESRDASSCPPSPPTLAGLNISDDKEEELEDLSLALQLLLDVDEARRREEEERKAKEAEEEKLRKTGGLRVPRRRLITSLPADWFQKVTASLQAHPSKTLAVTAESVELRKHDFAKVVPETEWLNDEIVNGSLQWLDRYVNAAAGATDVKSPNRVCLAMGSFFYKRLEDNGVQNTERALRRYGVTKANFLKLETILMPICKNNHWTLLVVRPQKRTVSHMDSFNPRGSAVHTNRALAWVEALLGSDYKASEWRTVCHEAPLQRNGYDCGVFTITNGMCLALGLNAMDTYSGEDLPLQRLRIAGMLLNKGFSGEFDLAGL